MKGITIATFISNKENENIEFYKLSNFLQKQFKVQTIIFSNKQVSNNKVKVFVTPKMTKYKRIQLLMKEAKYTDILCIDNDITPDKKAILNFIKKCSSQEYSIAWGKIKADNQKGIIPKLIDIDKNLSHDYIRPLLWNLNVGISLPGQIFMINKNYLENSLPLIDTVYDDLMIGAVVREKKYPVLFTQDVLGFEKPKKNIGELLKQRIRWAKGLAETIIYNKKNKVLPFVLLHGFSFNLLWLPSYLIIIILFKMNLVIGFIAIAAIIYLLTEKNIKKIHWAIIYMILFPFVYLVWGSSLIYYLISLNNQKRKSIKMWKKSLKVLFKKQFKIQEKEFDG